MKKQTTIYIIIGIVLTGLIIGIVMYVRKKKETALETGNASGTKTTPPSTGSSSKPAPPKTTPPPTPAPGNFNPGPLADEIFREIDDNGTFSIRNPEPYNKLNLLSDADFRKVNDSFNSRYKSRVNNLTLRKALAEERTTWTPSWYNATQKVLQRMQILQIV